MWVRAIVAVTLLLALIGVELAESLPGPLSVYPPAGRAIAITTWIAAIPLVSLAFRPHRLQISPRRVWPFVLLAFVLTLAVLSTGTAQQVVLDRLAGANQTRHALYVLRAVTDWDRDGVSSFFGGKDCSPFNVAVSTRAPEIPGNGRDDNCRFGDAPRRVAHNQNGPHGPEGPRSTTNVVLITVDALRPDHLGSFGYRRRTSPALDAFARQSMRFVNAYTSAPFTSLALPSLLSGVYPSHLAFHSVGLTRSGDLVSLHPDGSFLQGKEVILTMTEPIDKQRWLLQETLRRHGMRTAAVVSTGLRHMRTTVGRGWDRFEIPREEDDSAVTALAVRLLAEFRKEPLFLWVHYYDPHEIDRLHPGVAKFGETMIDHYDHQVAAVDREIGNLLAAIDADTSRATAVLLTADHGETLSGPIQYHGGDLGMDSMHIPMMLRVLGRSSGTITTPASLVDIAPTVLALTGAPAIATLDGQDLQNLRGPREVLTELWRLSLRNEPFIDQVAATDERFLLVYDRLNDAFTLTRAGDLKRPPDEIPLERTPADLRRRLESYIDERQRLPWELDNQ